MCIFSSYDSREVISIQQIQMMSLLALYCNYPMRRNKLCEILLKTKFMFDNKTEEQFIKHCCCTPTESEHIHHPNTLCAGTKDCAHKEPRAKLLKKAITLLKFWRSFQMSFIFGCKSKCHLYYFQSIAPDSLRAPCAYGILFKS